MIAISLAATMLAVQVGRHWSTSLGAWNVSPLAALLFLVVVGVASHFLPAIDEVPPGFPASLLWRFRVALLETLIVLWSSIGLLFGGLTEWSEARRAVSAPIS